MKLFVLLFGILFGSIVAALDENKLMYWCNEIEGLHKRRVTLTKVTGIPLPLMAVANPVGRPSTALATKLPHIYSMAPGATRFEVTYGSDRYEIWFNESYGESFADLTHKPAAARTRKFHCSRSDEPVKGE